MPDLVTTRSEDGLHLEGLLWDGRERDTAFILLHGFASRFYASVVARVAEALAARGHPALSGNTRGHDYGTMVVRRDGTTALQGAAWEDPAEGPLDVAGWVAWMERRLAPRRMILIGHSLGGWKAALYRAQRRDPRVGGLVLMSPPPRGTPTWWRPELGELAARMVAEGRGDDLVPGVQSRAGRVSAQTLVARGADRWPEDLAAYLPRVPVPALVTFGEREPDAVGRLAALAHLQPAVQTRLIAGGNHNYTDRWEAAAELVLGWLPPILDQATRTAPST